MTLELIRDVHDVAQAWKLGKRKAEKDDFVGAAFFKLISPDVPCPRSSYVSANAAHRSVVADKLPCLYACTFGGRTGTPSHRPLPHIKLNVCLFVCRDQDIESFGIFISDFGKVLKVYACACACAWELLSASVDQHSAASHGTSASAPPCFGRKTSI